MSATTKQLASPPSDWTDVLRAHGLRATRASMQVLGTLQSANQTLTHDELLVRLQSSFNGDAPDKVTVYRILERLCEVNLLKKVAGIDRARRYSLQTPNPQSAFECDSCHTLTELGGDSEIKQAMEVINQRLKANGMRTNETLLSAHGTCADCLASNHAP